MRALGTVLSILSAQSCRVLLLPARRNRTSVESRAQSPMSAMLGQQIPMCCLTRVQAGHAFLLTSICLIGCTTETARATGKTIAATQIDSPAVVTASGLRDTAYLNSTVKVTASFSGVNQSLRLQYFEYLCPDECKLGGDLTYWRLVTQPTDLPQSSWTVLWAAYGGSSRLVSDRGVGYLLRTPEDSTRPKLYAISAGQLTPVADSHPAWTSALRGKAFLHILFDSRLDGNLADDPRIVRILRNSGFGEPFHAAIKYAIAPTGRQLVTWDPKPMTDAFTYVGPFASCEVAEFDQIRIDSVLRAKLGFVHPLIGCERLSP
jgi:hypothetical protein